MSEWNITARHSDGDGGSGSIDALFVSASKNREPINHNTPASTNTATTTKNAVFQCSTGTGTPSIPTGAFASCLPAIAPSSGGESASPRAWIRKMLSANAVARTFGCVTFARIVLAGPVLKNRKKTAKNSSTHANGNGVTSISNTNGQAINIPAPETMKYAPGVYRRSLSPAK